MSDYRIGKEFDIGFVGTEGSGEGYVRIGESFADLSVTLQRDLLSDWMCDLREYISELDAIYDEEWKQLREKQNERAK